MTDDAKTFRTEWALRNGDGGWVLMMRHCDGRGYDRDGFTAIWQDAANFNNYSHAAQVIGILQGDQ